MNNLEALEILIDYQKYIRGEGEYGEVGVIPKYDSLEISKAIDTAILELNK